VCAECSQPASQGLDPGEYGCSLVNDGCQNAISDRNPEIWFTANETLPRTNAHQHDQREVAINAEPFDSVWYLPAGDGHPITV